MSTLQTAAPLVGPNPLTDRVGWLQWRQSGIGASEAAAACGISRYRQPLDIYLEKRGEIEPSEESDAMRLGLALEPVVISEYERRVGVRVARPLPSHRHKQHTFMLATPDGVLDDGEDRRLVEAKTTSHWRTSEFGEEGSDDVPDDYVLQCQQQMAVMDKELCDLAVLIDGRTLRRYTIHRNERLIDRIIVIEAELWERIENGDPPEPNWEHAHTPELVKRLHGLVEGETLPLSDEVAAVWQESQRLNKEIKQMKAEQDMLRAKVLHILGDCQVGILPDGEKEIYRTITKETRITQADVGALAAKIGQVKRRSFVSLRERIIKS